MVLRARLVLLGAAVCALPSVGVAQPADADFFAGKQINVMIGFPPAGGYDLYGRLFARHIGKHIPGNPNVTPQNRPGASGLAMSQWLYHVASKDGLNLGTVPQNAPTEEALGNPAARFESAKFEWIGRMTSNVPAHYIWHTAPARTIADAKTMEILSGADALMSTQGLNPTVLNVVTGSKFKVIPGYRGGAGARIAIEAGELQAGVAPVALLRSELAHWLRDEKIRVLVQYAPQRHSAFPDVPASVELATNAEDKKLLNFFVADSAIGRSIAAPPGVPPARIEALRRAFDAMIDDEAFKREAEKANIEIDPLGGRQLQALVADMLDMEPRVLERARTLVREINASSK